MLNRGKNYINSLLLLFFISLTGLAYGHGAYHDVVASLEKKLAKNPNDAALHFKLAEAHVGHEEWRACLNELERVEALAPKKFPTVYLRGLALHLGDQQEAAKKELYAVLAAEPDHINALATRGKVFMKMNQLPDAAADFQKAVHLTGAKKSEIVSDLATCYAQMGMPEEASKTIDAALKNAGNNSSLLYTALDIEIKASLWDAALRRIDALAKTAPSESPWMAERARLLTRAGRKEDSRAAWVSLRDHLLALPSLERGTPQNASLLHESLTSLGEEVSAPVSAPPAP